MKSEGMRHVRERTGRDAHIRKATCMLGAGTPPPCCFEACRQRGNSPALWNTRPNQIIHSLRTTDNWGIVSPIVVTRKG